MKLRKSSTGGGESFSIQKFILQIFANCRLYFGHEFRKNLQYDFPKIRGWGVKGRLELFRKFIRFGNAGHPLDRAIKKNNDNN